LSAQVLTINITGIKNSNGVISLAFFKSSNSFKNEKPVFTKIIKKTKVKNGELTVNFSDIPKGTYGIALLDDKNRNTKMDYSFFVPSEGFGFSNYYHSGMRKPNFAKFQFNFGTSDKTINIKVRYM
jgi:uncharacterized protein (DUF2141 family)